MMEDNAKTTAGTGSAPAARMHAALCEPALLVGGAAGTDARMRHLRRCRLGLAWLALALPATRSTDWYGEGDAPPATHKTVWYDNGEESFPGKFLGQRFFCQPWCQSPCDELHDCHLRDKARNQTNCETMCGACVELAPRLRDDCGDCDDPYDLHRRRECGRCEEMEWVSACRPGAPGWPNGTAPQPTPHEDVHDLRRRRLALEAGRAPEDRREL